MLLAKSNLSNSNYECSDGSTSGAAFITAVGAVAASIFILSSIVTSTSSSSATIDAQRTATQNLSQAQIEQKTLPYQVPLLPIYNMPPLPRYSGLQVERDKNASALLMYAYHVPTANDLQLMLQKIVSSAGIAVLNKLSTLAETNPEMCSQINDARKFAMTFPDDISVPHVWTDGEVEVVFEWIGGQRHAFVTFEGGGEFGYAFRDGDKFVPGSDPGTVLSAPSDLVEYLRQK